MTRFEGTAGGNIGITLPAGREEATAANNVDALVDLAQEAAEVGISSAGLTQSFDHDALSIAAMLGRPVPHIAIGGAGGSKGKRYALPHARIPIHQPRRGGAGRATDIEIRAKEILRMQDLLNQMVPAETGPDVDRVAGDTEPDFITSADEAQKYGIIDEVITTTELAFVPQTAGVA